jgi:hypothetical protein
MDGAIPAGSNVTHGETFTRIGDDGPSIRNSDHGHRQPSAGIEVSSISRDRTSGAGAVRPDFLYEVRGSRFKAESARQGLAAVADKPRWRASSRRSRRVSADCRSRRERGSTWHCREQVVGVSTCASHSKLSPTTVLRPDRTHRGWPGGRPSCLSPVSPRAVVGVASGGERSSRPPVGGRPLPPRPRAARLGDAPARPYAASPARARSCRKKPTLRRLGRLPLVCGRRRGVRTKGGVRGCATLEWLRSRRRHMT